MVEPAQVQAYIEQGVACAFIKVVGDGQHFVAIIVSDDFQGKNRIQRRQHVYKALGERMGGEIHALAMKVFTTEEWETQRDQFDV